MQQFCNKWGKRRMLNICQMTVKDVVPYYEQFLDLTDLEKLKKGSDLKNRIDVWKGRKEHFYWVLAIKSKDNKLVGKLDVFEMSNDRVSVSIEIPNENWVYKYGTEAIDQFIKICKENHLFKEIEFIARNEIIEIYRKQHEMKEKEYIINIAS